MPRYFFNVADGEIMRDPDGVVLPGVSEARAHALTVAGTAIQKLGETVWKGDEWEVWVTDESDATICSVVFRAKAEGTDDNP